MSQMNNIPHAPVVQRAMKRNSLTEL